MPGPRDWLHRAAESAPGRADSTVLDGEPLDPEDIELNRMLKDQVRQDKRDRLAGLLADAARRQKKKALEDELEIQQLQRKLDGDYDEPRGRGGHDDNGSDVILALRSDFASQQAELVKRLEAMQGSMATQRDTAIQAQLQSMKDMIGSINANAQTANPIQTMIDSFGLAAKIREAADNLSITSPPATALPMDPGFSRQQMIDREKMELEHQIRLLDGRAALETVQLERERLIAQREDKQARLDGLLNLGEGVLGKLMEVAGPGLAGMIPGGGGGNGGGPPESSGSMMPVPAAPMSMVTFPCPNPQCGQSNSVPPGTSHTQCQHCGYPIELRPRGSGRPPAA